MKLLLLQLQLQLLLLLALAALDVTSFVVLLPPPTKTRQRLVSFPLFNGDIPDFYKQQKPSSIAVNGATAPRPMSALSTGATKIGLMSFILSMCIALPVTLLPQKLLYKAQVIDKVQSEKAALWTGQFCARWLVRLIPFVNIETISSIDSDPDPAIWVCNHCSMLDIFMLLACDQKLRGNKKRPIKIVYWKQLEDNLVTKLLFQQCGFIPVDMADNGNGNENEYDMSSFRSLLKETKQALNDGFDIGILPEGQPNPNPEAGLLPIFSGAYTLARMSKRPIHMMAMHGVHKLWHPENGMECTGRTVKIRCYPHGRKYASGDEFIQVFTNVVGHFGQTGEDIEDVQQWLDGTKWQEQKMQKSKSA